MDDVKDQLAAVREIYQKLIQILPSFKIADRTVLPYGLKPHTRSVSWLVEQVINQQAKFNARALGLDDVNFDLPDTCLHDAVLTRGSRQFFVNIKAHNADGRESKNDIAAVEKLYMQYRENQDYNIIYAVFGIRFDDTTIKFDPKYLEVFSVQFLPIYVNPRNDKIQASYHHTPILRSREEFLRLLAQNSKSIALGDGRGN